MNKGEDYFPRLYIFKIILRTDMCLNKKKRSKTERFSFFIRS